MCLGAMNIWQCKRCHNAVLKDTWKQPIFSCAAAIASGTSSCNYAGIEWTVARKRCGLDVNPRESLTNPSIGTCFLSWTETLCLGCQTEDEIKALNLHADSPELDTWEDKSLRETASASELDARTAKHVPWEPSTPAQQAGAPGFWADQLSETTAVGYESEEDSKWADYSEHRETDEDDDEEDGGARLTDQYVFEESFVRETVSCLYGA
jgi:hypothetical protein